MSWTVVFMCSMCIWALAVSQAEENVMRLVKPTYELLNECGQKLLQNINILTTQYRLWAYMWISFGLPVGNSFYLLGMIRRMMLMREEEKLSGPEHFTKLIVDELKKDFRWLIASCLIISSTLLLDIMAAVVFLHFSWHITSNSKSWEIAKLIWRILTGRNAADEARFHEAVMLNSKTQYVPNLSLLLLRWDTTINWGETKLVENFPGLRIVEGRSSESDGSFFNQFAVVNVWVRDFYKQQFADNKVCKSRCP
ncbi:hypothetical protein DFH28DRAFT_1160714 [Melampsora americana]|nr:hypothetical protein DFH28DRAFT_1160714 [Melampsora americana]